MLPGLGLARVQLVVPYIVEAENADHGRHQHADDLNQARDTLQYATARLISLCRTLHVVPPRSSTKLHDAAERRLKTRSRVAGSDQNPPVIPKATWSRV